MKNRKEGTATARPRGSLQVRAYKGRPFYEARWRDRDRVDRRKRLGPAWTCFIEAFSATFGQTPSHPGLEQGALRDPKRTGGGVLGADVAVEEGRVVGVHPAGDARRAGRLERLEVLPHRPGPGDLARVLQGGEAMFARRREDVAEAAVRVADFGPRDPDAAR
jgi:hypothetical protein